MTRFGRIVAHGNVEDAVVEHLRTWVAVYLGQLETQNDLERGALYRPPNPSSFYGGVDFDSWSQDDLPAYIVTVEPAGEPDHFASSGYGQVYAVGIAVVVIMQSEQESRRIAGYHGAAVMGAMVQLPDLGGFAVNTAMQSAPAVDFPDQDEARLTRCQATYHVRVDPIVDDMAGPGADAAPDDEDDPEGPWPDWPTVETVTTTVTPVEEIDP